MGTGFYGMGKGQRAVSPFDILNRFSCLPWSFKLFGLPSRTLVVQKVPSDLKSTEQLFARLFALGLMLPMLTKAATSTF